MQPLNYQTNAVNPLQMALAGYDAGNNVRQQQQKIEAIELQKQQAQQMRVDMAALVENPNASARDYASMMAKYPQAAENIKNSFDFLDESKRTAAFDTLTKAYSALSTGNNEVAQDMLNRHFQAAKEAGNVKEAVNTRAMQKVLEMNPQAAKTSVGILLAGAMGKDKFAEAMERIQGAEIAAEKAPLEQEKMRVDIASTKGKEQREQQIMPYEIAQTQADIESKKAGTLGKLGDEERSRAMMPYEMEGARADIAETRAGTQIALSKEQRAREIAPYELQERLENMKLTRAQVNKAMVDARKSEAEIGLTNANAKQVAATAALKIAELRNGAPLKLSADTQKLINKSVVEAANTENLANQYDGLAGEIDKAIAAGTSAKASETWKRIWGTEDEITRFRQEYKRLRNSQVLQMLPAGAASDADIAIAMSAFPEDTANPEVISSFLKGMAKLQRYDAGLKDSQAQWASANGNLGNARKDMVIAGKLAKKGQSFNEFMKAEQLNMSTSSSNRLPQGISAGDAGKIYQEWDDIQAKRSTPLPDDMREQYFNKRYEEMLKKKVSSKPTGDLSFIKKYDKKLVGVKQPAVDFYKGFAKYAKDKAGIKIGISQGHRTKEYQNKLYEQGRTTAGKIVTWTRNSKHMSGNALDFFEHNVSPAKISFRRVDQIRKLMEEYASTRTDLRIRFLPAAKDPLHVEVWSK